MTDANGNLIPVAVDATSTGKDKSKAQATKAKAIDDATYGIISTLAPEFEQKYELRATGQQPVKTTTEDIIDPETGDKVGEKTLYWTGSGWSEDVNEALMEPAGYEEKVPLPRPQYTAVRRRVIGMLRNKLRRYVKDPKRYQQLADEIMSTWFTIPTGKPPNKVPGNSQAAAAVNF